MAYDYREQMDDHSPSTAGFGVEGGRAVLQLFVDDTDLDLVILDLLGDVEVDPQHGGGLKRRLPKAHPRWPYLFASRISNIQGRVAREYSSARSDLEAEPLDQYGAYDQYLLTVEFEPRPYAVIKDHLIGVDSTTYYDDADNPVTKAYSPEWGRFCFTNTDPRPEIIHAQQGQSVFKLAGGPAPRPNGEAFSGFPQMTVPQAEITMTWVQVPASYVDHPNSYLVKYAGRINQTDWLTYPAGSLRYEGCSSRRYTPCIPEMISTPLGHTTVSMERLCDITLRFTRTDRVVKYPPTPPNRSWIAAGWNAMPWLLGDRGFYYVCNKSDDPLKQVPPFLSSDFRLLFTDPSI